MRPIIAFCFLFTTLCAQPVPPTASTQLNGTIKNYEKQSLYLYKCYGDTVLLADSMRTDEKGKFIFQIAANDVGLYKVVLQRNQYFYLLNDGGSVKIQTIYIPDAFYNIATDSLKVITSEENKHFYEFQLMQQRLNVANYWLLQMMRLYPLPDPFHEQIEAEYFKRYNAMEKFVKQQIKEHPESMATKIAKAYYHPVLPDWKEPDPDRNVIIKQHYFDYFNPTDSFYLHTNILPEKIDEWFSMHSNNRENSQWNENAFQQAADTFLMKCISQANRLIAFNSFEDGSSGAFVLNYILKKMNKEHYDNALLYLYDRYVKTDVGNCEPSNTAFNWIREKANTLRNVQIGSIAPDFDIEKGTLRMHQLKSDYTLILFWATWCPHCTQVLPEIKKAIDEFNKKNYNKNRLSTVAVSLDTDSALWKDFIQKGGYATWLNTSELKGWKGEVPKQYNVYATPTMFLLDKEKKIIAKPDNEVELFQLIDLPK